MKSEPSKLPSAGVVAILSSLLLPLIFLLLLILHKSAFLRHVLISTLRLERGQI